VEAMSPDGTSFRSLWHTRRLDRTEVEVFDRQANLYVVANGARWRVNVKSAADTGRAWEPRLPAMRVHIGRLFAADYDGRLWCSWKRADQPLAVFDGKAWTVRTSAELGLQTTPWTELALVALGPRDSLIVAGATGLVLRDADGVVAAKDFFELARKHADRLGRFFSQRWVWGYHWAEKDASGRIWWANWFYNWGAIEGDKIIDGKDSEVDFGPQSAEKQRPFNILTPVGDGKRLLLSAEDGGSAVVTVRDGRIVKVLDAPLAQLRSWERWAFRRRSGQLWVVTTDESYVIGPDGRPTAKHKGKLVLEDRQGGLWFWQHDREGWRAVRRGPQGGELVLDVPGLRERAALAEAPDGTMWLLTRAELIRVRLEGDRPGVVERYPMPVTNSDELWCRSDGRLWSFDWNGHLVLYATTPGAASPGR